jgi:hypothetical protein
MAVANVVIQRFIYETNNPIVSNLFSQRGLIIPVVFSGFFAYAQNDKCSVS